MEIRFLHTNDFHGKLNSDGFAILSELRERVDYYFDSGDAVRVGNVSIPLSKDEIWKKLQLLKCTASVPGNREFHINASVFRKKLQGLGHPMICGNLNWNGDTQKSLYGNQETPFPKTFQTDRIGVFGLMVPMVTDKMAARHVSAFINSDPIKMAPELVNQLQNDKIIICLSHLGLKRDCELAEKVAGIDIIFGGHSHDLLDPPLLINGTTICHSGSHGRFAGIYTFDVTSSQVKLKAAKFVDLSTEPSLSRGHGLG